MADLVNQSRRKKTLADQNRVLVPVRKGAHTNAICRPGHVDVHRVVSKEIPFGVRLRQFLDLGDCEATRVEPEREIRKILNLDEVE